jgi:hypothetical protein
VPRSTTRATRKPTASKRSTRPWLSPTMSTRRPIFISDARS